MAVNAEPGVRPQVVRGTELQGAAIRHAAGEQNLAPALSAEKQQVIGSAQKQLAESKPAEALGLLVTRLTATPEQVKTLAEQLLKTPDASTTQIASQDKRITDIQGLYAGLQTILAGNSPAQADMDKITDMFINAIRPNRDILAIYAPNGVPDNARVEIFLRSKAGERLAKNLNLIMEQAREKAVPAVLQNDADIRAVQRDKMKAESEVNTARARKEQLETSEKKLLDFNNAADKQGRMTQLDGELAQSTNQISIEFAKNLAEQQSLTERQRVNGSLNPKQQSRLNILNKNIDAAMIDPTDGINCREYASLYREKYQLLQTVKEAAVPGALNAATNDLLAKEKELRDLNARENSLVASREASVSTFESQVNNVVGETAIEVFKDDVSEFMSQYPKYEKEALDVLEKSGREALKVYMDTRYKHTKETGHLWFKKTIQEFDSKQITEDMAELMGTNPPNPDALIKKWMGPTGANMSAEQQAAILNNPDTMASLRQDMVAKLFVASTQTGQRFDERQIRAIADTDWGGPALDQMLTRNADIKRYLEKVVGKGYGSKDVLNKFGALNFLFIILMALGIVKTPGVPLNEN